MDRSVLSDAAVVKASRDFVCARLATYEDAEEATFLADVFRGRSGELENTVFTILAPDGETKLTGAGRSPEMVFGDRRRGPPGRGGPPGERDGPPPESAGGDAPGGANAKMVAEMHRIAAEHPVKASAAKEPGAMPYAQDVRLALNVAACDMLPVAVVVAKDTKSRQALEKELRALAWSDAFIGRFVWAHAEDTKELSAIADVSGEARLVVAQPDAYGLKGTLLAQADVADAATLKAALEKALAEHDPGAKDAGAHIREGRRQGVDWKSAVPVTDPHAPPPRDR